MIDRSPVLNGRAATLHPLPRPPTSRALSLGGTELNPTVRAHVSVRYTNISGTRLARCLVKCLTTLHTSLSAAACSTAARNQSQRAPGAHVVSPLSPGALIDVHEETGLVRQRLAIHPSG
jgi:hypothetical protein